MDTKTQNPSPQPTMFKRRGRIVFYLLAVLVFVGLVPLASIAWKLIDTNRSTLITVQQEYQLLLASSIASELNTHVEGLRSELAGVAQTLGAAIDRQGRIRSGELRGVLADVVSGPLLYLQYNFSTSERGERISAGEIPEGCETVFSRGIEEAVIALAGSGGQRGTRAVLSDPVFGERVEDGGLLIVTAPVFVQGHFRGVLTGLVDLQAVWETVISHTRTGHDLYALDRSGRVFASSDPTRIAIGGYAGNSALVQRFLSSKIRGASETMPYTLEHDGISRKYLGSFAGSGKNWGVFVRAPERQAYLAVRTMIESSLTWSLVALLLAVITAVFFANTLSGPINRLAEASLAFSRGDFTIRVETGSRTELGELAFTFNKMADDIEGHIYRLRRAAEENNELFLGTIRALAQAIDAKDRYTRGHSVRVNKYAVIIAQELELSDREIRDIHVASLLHDVGKIGVTDAVLNKPGKLTDAEFDLMKKHTIFGANIMAPIKQMKNIIPGLRWHHERWAGGGYPDGLAGDQIPLMARIIAVADTFDAVTTTRPYQKTMTVPEALQTIKRLTGVTLDERIVEAFFRAYRAGKIRVPKPTQVATQPAVRQAVSAT